MVADPVPPHPGGPEPYWKCVVAAVPLLLMSLEFELVSRGQAPFGLTAQDLIAALSGEVVGIFLGVVVAALCLFLSGSGFTRALRNLSIVTVLIGIAASAYDMGAAVAIQFLVMLLITCLGLVISWKNPAATLQLASRCVAAYAALVVAMQLCSAPEISEWHDDARVIQTGNVYFFILAAVELSGLHLRVIPRNRVAIWTWLYAIVGKTYP